MKIKIDQNITEFDGSPFEVTKTPATRNLDGSITPEITETLTFRAVIDNSLKVNVPNHPMTTEELIKAFRIGNRLSGKKRDEYDLTTDQIVFLKLRVGLVYLSPVVYGRFLQLIGDESVKQLEEE
jgi:hypothetical protein